MYDIDRFIKMQELYYEIALSEIKESRKIITDYKNSYESVTKENCWNLKQVKSSRYMAGEVNTLANIIHYIQI